MQTIIFTRLAQSEALGCSSTTTGQAQSWRSAPAGGWRIALDMPTHWEKIYTQKAPDQVGWYRPDIETWLALIEQALGRRSAAIIDVGAGEATLVAAEMPAIAVFRPMLQSTSAK